MAISSSTGFKTHLFGKNQSMLNAFKLFFTRWTDVKGRSSRREFWLGVLPNAIIMVIIFALLLYSLFGLKPMLNPFSITMIIISALFCIIELVPSISLIFRRMHDIGKSGEYIAVLLIPIAGYVWYIWLVTRETDYFRKNNT